MCSFLKCMSKNSIIGFCNHCKQNFCNIHRLYESHNCSCLSEIKSKEHNNLSEKLLNESKLLNKKIQQI